MNCEICDAHSGDNPICQDCLGEDGLPYNFEGPLWHDGLLDYYTEYDGPVDTEFND